MVYCVDLCIITINSFCCFRIFSDDSNDIFSESLSYMYVEVEIFNHVSEHSRQDKTKTPAYILYYHIRAVYLIFIHQWVDCAVLLSSSPAADFHRVHAVAQNRLMFS
jgi:hypothetical protein